MKKIRLFLFLFSSVVTSSIFVVSCTKTNNLEADEDDIEIDDSNPFDDEDISLEDRAATPFTFASFISENQIPSNNKYVGGITLSGIPNSKTKLTITGTNFGTKDSTTFLTCLSKGEPVTLEILSWSDTQIVLKLPGFPKGTKNLSLKFRLQKTILGKIKSRTKTVKSAAAYLGFGEEAGLIEDTGGNDRSAYYPSSLWEVAFSQDERGTLGTHYYSESNPITSSYEPQVGDLVTRESGYAEMQYGIVVAPKQTPYTSGVHKDFGKVKINERNLKGKGGLQRKSYYYNAGVFKPKLNEGAWTHWRREISL